MGCCKNAATVVRWPVILAAAALLLVHGSRVARAARGVASPALAPLTSQDTGLGSSFSGSATIAAPRTGSNVAGDDTAATSAASTPSAAAAAAAATETPQVVSLASGPQDALSKEETLGCPQLQFYYLGTELLGDIQHEALGAEVFIDKPSTRNTQTLGVEMVLEETLFSGVRLDIFELRMPRDLQRSELKSIATLDDTAVLRRVGFESLFPNNGRIESVVELPASTILSPDGTGGDANSSVSDGDVTLLYFNTWDMAQMPLTIYFKVSCPGGDDGAYQVVEQLLQAGGFTGELLRYGSRSWVVSVRGMVYFAQLPADRGTIQFADFAAEPGELTIENMPPLAVVETNATRFLNPSYSFIVNVTQLPEGGLQPITLEAEAAPAPAPPPGQPVEEPDSELNDLETLKETLAAAPAAAIPSPARRGSTSSSSGSSPGQEGGDGSGGEGSGGGDRGIDASKLEASDAASSSGEGSGGSSAAAPIPSSPDSPTAALAVGFSLAGVTVVVMVAIVLYWQFGGRRVRVKDENDDVTYKSVT